jgi:hypothetical protein
VVVQETSWQKGVLEETAHLTAFRKNRQRWIVWDKNRPFKVLFLVTYFLQASPTSKSPIQTWTHQWINPSMRLVPFYSVISQWCHQLELKPSAQEPFEGTLHIQVIKMIITKILVNNKGDQKSPCMRMRNRDFRWKSEGFQLQFTDMKSMRFSWNNRFQMKKVQAKIAFHGGVNFRVW